jgi:hypothetical protein
MSLRLPLSGYLLALSALEIADGLPDLAASYGAMVVGLLLALTVIADRLYFGDRP